ncbi:MAG: hypothetical protein V4568_09330 [Pseudomonadota bacterium]
MQTSLGEEAAAQRKTTTLNTDDIYPKELAEAERKLIEERHRDLDLTESKLRIGVALSGGGIRSATFSLGLFQSFARHDLLKRIDYLSTVSGGGYFGGFFGKLFLSSGHANSPTDAAQHVRDTLTNTQSPPINWLRENGRYIAPTGSGDYFYAMGTYLRNWTAVQYVVGITLLTLFLIANALRGWAWKTSWGVQLEVLVGNATLPYLWASPWLLIPAFIAAFFLIPLGGAYWLTQRHQVTKRRLQHRFYHYQWNYPLLGLILLIITAATALIAAREKIIDWIPSGPSPTTFYVYVIAGGFLAIIAYFFSRFKAPTDQVLASYARNRLSRWLSSGILVFVLLAIFGLIDSFGQTLYAISSAKTGQIVFTGIATSLLVLLARHFTGYLSKDPKKTPKVIRIPFEVITFSIGALLAIVVATFWATLAHAILWKGEIPHGNPGHQLLAFYASSTPQVSLSSQHYIVVSPPVAQEPIAEGTAPAIEFVTAACGLAMLISLLTGQTMTFLNLSSIQEFYASRLSRAYLGASNPHRTGFGISTAQCMADPSGECSNDVTKVIPQDDVQFTSYRPELSGGPIHLINITINETIAGTSQLEQRDRKGLGMAIGPCGVNVGRTHHAVWSNDEEHKLCKLQAIAPSGDQFTIFSAKPTEIESLSLGQLVAISGAAFSTGLGARTNIGMSLLLGLSNVRIGYWWDSGITPRSRTQNKQTAKQQAKISDWMEPLFSTQVYLSDEFLARFHGPRRQRWYLSDGGHFENTAVYELIRRRLPLIIVSDNGCDQDYLFDDLANLIRKARIDFNAEIRFLEEGELNALLDQNLRRIIGTPAELQRQITDGRSPDGNKRFAGQAYCNCHALLARVYYDGSNKAGSLMLIIKPSLTGDEPLDLLEYYAQHAEFPQESTLDQFFDEAQWESYRKLGSYIGDRLLGEIPGLEKWMDLLMEKTEA